MTVTLHVFLIIAAVCFAIALIGTLGWLSRVNVMAWTDGGLLAFVCNGLFAFGTDRVAGTK